MGINERNKRRTKRKILKAITIAANSLFFTIIGVVILFVAISNIDLYSGYRFPIFGCRSSVIVSESMAYRNPENTYLTEDMYQIKKNDLIITKQYSSYDDIELYDVITYSEGSILVCHRVVEKYENDGKQIIVTRGDSNSISDTPIEYSLVKGKVINVVPSIGAVLLIFQSPYILIAIFGSLFFIFLALFIIDVGSYYKYDKIIGKNKLYKEDKILIINSKEFDETKKKRDYTLIGGDNHYYINTSKYKIIMERYIRTDYENKNDKTVVSGIFDRKEIEETLVLSVLPIAIDLIEDGKNPFPFIKKQLKEKGIVIDDKESYAEYNEYLSSKLIDKKPLNKDSLNNYEKLSKSYSKIEQSIGSSKLLDSVYSYLCDCYSSDLDPIEGLVKKEDIYA